MSDRQESLEQVIADLLKYNCIDDAFLAKSVTDQLLILDVEQRDDIPEPVLDTLRANSHQGIESVYGEDSEARSVVGDISEVTRHHFVDAQTRGSHQSYVVSQWSFSQSVPTEPGVGVPAGQYRRSCIESVAPASPSSR